VVGKMKYQSILQDIQGELFPVGIPDEEGSLFFTIDEHSYADIVCRYGVR